MKLFRYPIPILIVMILIVLMVGSVLDSQRQTSLRRLIPQEQENVVHSQESATEEIFQKCNPLKGLKSSKTECYGNEFFSLTLAKNHEFAFRVLFEIQKKDRTTLSCHLIAHSIGKAVFDRDPKIWKAEINLISPACTYGAIHGVIEQYTSASKRGLDRELLAGVCSPKNSGCLHAVGHIALVLAQDNIPGALDFCSVFEKGGQFGCLTGVFMENITALSLLSHGYRESAAVTQGTLQSAEKLCRSLEDKSAEACWKEIIHAVGSNLLKNPQAFFDFCHTAQTPGAAKRCKLHALDIFVMQRSFDLFLLKDLCKSENDRDQTFENSCYNHLAGSMVTRAPQQVPQVVSFCLSLNEEFQKQCLGEVDRALQAQPQWVLKTLKEFCTNSTDEVQEYCIQSIHAE